MGSHKGQHKLDDAMKVAENVIDYLREYCHTVEVCGSIRRQCEIVRDVDLIATPHSDTSHDFCQVAYSSGWSGGPIKFNKIVDGISVDVNIVSEDCWGAAEMHHTGSPLFNVGCRTIAKVQGWSLSQHGGLAVPIGADETEIFKILGLNFIPPVERSIYDMDDFWSLSKEYKRHEIFD